MSNGEQGFDWSAVIARCLAYLCLKNSKYADSPLLEQAAFLERLGLPLSDRADVLGSSREESNGTGPIPWRQAIRPSSPLYQLQRRRQGLGLRPPELHLQRRWVSEGHDPTSTEPATPIASRCWERRSRTSPRSAESSFGDMTMPRPLRTLYRSTPTWRFAVLAFLRGGDRRQHPPERQPPRRQRKTIPASPQMKPPRGTERAGRRITPSMLCLDPLNPLILPGARFRRRV